MQKHLPARDTRKFKPKPRLKVKNAHGNLSSIAMDIRLQTAFPSYVPPTKKSNLNILLILIYFMRTHADTGKTYMNI